MMVDRMYKGKNMLQLPKLNLEIVTLGLSVVSEDVIALAIVSVALRSLVEAVWICIII